MRLLSLFILCLCSANVYSDSTVEDEKPSYYFGYSSHNLFRGATLEKGSVYVGSYIEKKPFMLEVNFYDLENQADLTLGVFHKFKPYGEVRIWHSRAHYAKPENDTSHSEQELVFLLMLGPLIYQTGRGSYEGEELTLFSYATTLLNQIDSQIKPFGKYIDFEYQSLTLTNGIFLLTAGRQKTPIVGGVRTYVELGAVIEDFYNFNIELSVGKTKFINRPDDFIATQTAALLDMNLPAYLNNQNHVTEIVQWKTYFNIDIYRSFDLL